MQTPRFEKLAAQFAARPCLYLEGDKGATDVTQVE